MKRWLLWNLRCRRGRRCANLLIIPSDDGFPPGVSPMVTYTCCGCGTDYLWNARSGTRRRIKEIAL